MAAPEPTRLPRRSLVAAAAIVIAAVIAVDLEAAVSGPRDAVGDLSTLAERVAAQATSVSPAVLTVLIAVAAAHYVCAGIAARAAAGVPLPRAETVAVTLISAAANRVTLAGAGGALVMGRFLSRRGGLGVAEATGAVTVLALVGGLADVAAFGALALACVLTSAPHTGGAVAALTAKLSSAVPATSWTSLAVALGVVSVLCAVGTWAVRRRQLVARTARLWRDYRTAVAGLARSPRRLARLCLASSGTTVVLAAGFAAVAVMTPTGIPVADTGALLVGYMVSSAAGNAFPTPSGIGAADAAFGAVLVGLGSPIGPALTAVVAFRLVTFWLPAGLGVVLAHRLRRAQAL